MVDTTSTASFTSSSSSQVLPWLPTIWYCGCSFVANAGVAITGYGMALIFVTVYTVGELSGGFDDDDGGCFEKEQSDAHQEEVNLCGIKYAVFLQSLSLVGSMPMLLFAADAFRNSNPALLETLIPITLIATPFGQYCQTKISASWIKVVVGTVVVLVVLYKIILDIVAAVAAQQRRRKEQEQQEKHEGTTNGTESNETTTLLGDGSTTTSTAITPDDTADGNDDSKDRYYHGFSVVRIRLWGILLGGSSGFLGGLIGMRGPPLMIFFLAFPFPKSETRAVGAIMLCLNMMLRIGYYIVSDVIVGMALDNKNVDAAGHDVTMNGHHRWFFREEWVLYVGVIVSGTVAVFIGDWVHHKLDQNTFQRALALLLVATGIVNIWKGTSELHSGKGD